MNQFRATIATAALIAAAFVGVDAVTTDSPAEACRPSAPGACADIHAGSFEQRGVPPCDRKNGRGQKLCVWDAKHRGNGKGRSALIFKGKRGYVIPHKAAHKMVKSWERGIR